MMNLIKLTAIAIGLFAISNVEAKSIPGEKANQCIEFQEGAVSYMAPGTVSILNTCDFGISISWCLEKNGQKCTDVGADHVRPGHNWPLIGSNHKERVHAVACKDPALAIMNRKNPEHSRCGAVPADENTHSETLDEKDARMEKHASEENNRYVERLKKEHSNDYDLAPEQYAQKYSPQHKTLESLQREEVVQKSSGNQEAKEAKFECSESEETYRNAGMDVSKCSSFSNAYRH